MPLLTNRGLILLASGAIWLLLAGFLPLLAWLFPLHLIAALALIVADALSLRRTLTGLTIERRLPPQLAQFDPNTISYHWQMLGTIPVTLQLKESGIDPVPQIEPVLLQWEAAPRTEGVQHARLIVKSRGLLRFRELRLRATSARGLVRWQERRVQPSAVQVLPSLGIIRQLRLWAKREELALPDGVRLPRREEGTMFKELRPYSPGDELRRVDWKASARRRQLIVKEMEPERAQSVMVVLDLGRHMRAPAGDTVPRLDASIHAALALAWVAIEQGDLAGGAAFGAELRFFSPPRSGPGQIRLLLDGLAPLQPESIEPDYRRQLGTLGSLLRKRTLIVLFTEVQGEDLSRELLTGLRMLSRRHLVCVVTLPDVRLHALATSQPTDESGLYQAGAAAEVLLDRAEALALVRRTGGMVVEAPPDRLAAGVIAAYLKAKSRGRL